MPEKAPKSTDGCGVAPKDGVESIRVDVTVTPAHIFPSLNSFNHGNPGPEIDARIEWVDKELRKAHA